MAQCVILLASPLGGGRPLTANGSADAVTYLIGGYPADVSLDSSTCPGFMLMTPTEFDQTHSAIPSDADLYAACSAIFAAGLMSLVFIYGVKQVLSTLNHSRSE